MGCRVGLAGQKKRTFLGDGTFSNYFLNIGERKGKHRQEASDKEVKEKKAPYTEYNLGGVARGTIRS